MNVTIKPKLYIIFFFHEHLFNTQIVHEKLNILSFFFYAHLYNPWMMVCATCVMEGGGLFNFGVALHKNQDRNIIRTVNLPLTSTVMKCQHSSPYV